MGVSRGILKYYASTTVNGDAVEEVKVTRKYQVTIPESVRSELGVKIGDKLIVKSENKRIIMEAPQHIANPSDTLWCLFGKPLDTDAVKLVEESWETHQLPAEPKKLSRSRKGAQA